MEDTLQVLRSPLILIILFFFLPYLCGLPSPYSSQPHPFSRTLNHASPMRPSAMPLPPGFLPGPLTQSLYVQPVTSLRSCIAITLSYLQDISLPASCKPLQGRNHVSYSVVLSRV